MFMIIEFVNTDLPEPVVPAISICGIFEISPTTILPSISLPTANISSCFIFLYSSLSISSLRLTVSLNVFGTSMPTAFLPIMGASILTPPCAARHSAMSLSSVVILFIFTPTSGLNSYLVTEGPLNIPVTVVFTPKLSSVFTSTSDFESISCFAFSVGTLFFAYLSMSIGGGVQTVFCSSSIIEVCPLSSTCIF